MTTSLHGRCVDITHEKGKQMKSYIDAPIPSILSSQSSTGDSDTSDVNVSTRAPSGRKECEEDGEDYQEREVMTDNQEREVVVDAQYFGHLVDDMPTLFIPDSTCSSFDEILQTYEEEVSRC